MNLTNLRRTVLAADLLALGAAGAAAWFSLQARPAEAKDWAKLFPVRPPSATDVQAMDLPPKDEFIRAIDFVQGEKPAPVDTSVKAEAPKEDPFKSKYKLSGLYYTTSSAGVSIQATYALLQYVQGGNTTPFGVGLGEQIPVEPGRVDKDQPVTPWRLNELHESALDPATKQQTNCTAVFVHVETGERQVLEMAPGNPIVMDNPPVISGAPGIGKLVNAGPPRDQRFRGVEVQHPENPNLKESILPDDEVEFLDAWGGDEVSKVSIVESRDPAGNPDGFVLKGVPKNSRADSVGFASEDKVVSVNDEKVSSTTDAMAKGKRQFEGGTTVFQIKVLRKGKEMTFTFHAPKKKAKP